MATQNPTGSTAPPDAIAQGKFLTRIPDQLLKIRDRYMIDFDGSHREALIVQLKSITAECLKLRVSPPMFYSFKQYAEFFRLVDLYTKQTIEVIRLWREHKDRWNEIRKQNAENSLRYARRRYSPQLVNQPWQQFLSTEAPGMPVGWALGPDIISRQVIPNAGVRIIENWEDEVREIYDWLDVARNRPSRFTSGLEEQTSTVYTLGDGNVRLTSIGTLHKSPFREMYSQGHSFYSGDLAATAMALGRLQGHQKEESWKAAVVKIKRRTTREMDKEGENDGDNEGGEDV